jgi:hypothetical protein
VARRGGIPVTGGRARRASRGPIRHRGDGGPAGVAENRRAASGTLQIRAVRRIRRPEVRRASRDPTRPGMSPDAPRRSSGARTHARKPDGPNGRSGRPDASAILGPEYPLCIFRMRSTSVRTLEVTRVVRAQPSRR